MSVALDRAEKLSPEDIEIINAYGPYNHSIWVGRGVEVTAEDAISGRARFLAKIIRQTILDQFTHDELAEMTILDIGCYDGWLLHELSDLPFKRLVGIEPREKNIRKGQNIRKLLGIDTRSEFQLGCLENVGAETFDIVLCAGVIHHLQSPAEGFAKLRSICRKLLIVEATCLSSRFITRDFRKAMEMKDIPYFFKDPICGITGNKMESAYYDGSATHYTVVSLISQETMRMYLETQGFTNVTSIATPDDYSSIFKSKERRYAMCCMSARVDVNFNQQNEAKKWCFDYENGLIATILPVELVSALYDELCLRKSSKEWTIMSKIMSLYITSRRQIAEIIFFFIGRKFSHSYTIELLKNMRYNYGDKIALEYAKVLVSKGSYQEGILILDSITKKINADWRATYRSFCLLVWLYEALGDFTTAERYKALCRVSNPSFPETLLAAGVGVLHAGARVKISAPVHSTEIISLVEANSGWACDN